MTKRVLETADIIERKDLTPDLMILKIVPNFGFPAFKPGQYCTLAFDGAKPKPYSIVSSPSELPMIELFIELVPEQFKRPDSLTPKLWQLKVGDKVEIFPTAKGSFLLDENYNAHIMISTVTGIAPFISMIRSTDPAVKYYQKYSLGPLGFAVFQGASYIDEFGYFEELSFLAEHSLLIYIPTISRPNEEKNSGWSGATGRVNDFFIRELEEPQSLLEKDKTIVYLCGNEKMIDHLGNKKATPEKPLGKLVEKGFKVKQEVYF